MADKTETPAALTVEDVQAMIAAAIDAATTDVTVMERAIEAATANLTVKLPVMIGQILDQRAAEASVAAATSAEEERQQREAQAAEQERISKAAIKAEGRRRQARVDAADALFKQVNATPDLPPLSALRGSNVEMRLSDGATYHPDLLFIPTKFDAAGDDRAIYAAKLAVSGDLPSFTVAAIDVLVCDSAGGVIAATSCTISPPVTVGDGKSMEIAAGSLLFPVAVEGAVMPADETDVDTTSNMAPVAA